VIAPAAGSGGSGTTPTTTTGTTTAAPAPPPPCARPKITQATARRRLAAPRASNVIRFGIRIPPPQWKATCTASGAARANAWACQVASSSGQCQGSLIAYGPSAGGVASKGERIGCESERAAAIAALAHSRSRPLAAAARATTPPPADRPAPSALARTDAQAEARSAAAQRAAQSDLLLPPGAFVATCAAREPNEDGKAQAVDLPRPCSRRLLPRHRCRRADRQGRDRRSPADPLPPGDSSNLRRPCRRPTRLIPQFAAEPPQETLPYGRWADLLRGQLLRRSCAWRGRGGGPRRAGRHRLVPRPHLGRAHVRARDDAHTTGLELYATSSFTLGERGPDDFDASAFATDILGRGRPAGRSTSSDDEIAPGAATAAARRLDASSGCPATRRRRVATAELAEVTSRSVRADREPLHADRPDRYPHPTDELQVALFNARASSCARVALRGDGDDEDDAEEGEAPTPPDTAAPGLTGSQTGRSDVSPFPDRSRSPTATASVVVCPPCG